MHSTLNFNSKIIMKLIEFLSFGVINPEVLYIQVAKYETLLIVFSVINLMRVFGLSIIDSNRVVKPLSMAVLIPIRLLQNTIIVSLGIFIIGFTSPIYLKVYVCIVLALYTILLIVGSQKDYRNYIIPTNELILKMVDSSMVKVCNKLFLSKQTKKINASIYEYRKNALI